jgi:hypothetical protein
MQREAAQRAEQKAEPATEQRGCPMPGACSVASLEQRVAALEARAKRHAEADAELAPPMRQVAGCARDFNNPMNWQILTIAAALAKRFGEA